jgi:hypothetical protein
MDISGIVQGSIFLGALIFAAGVAVGALLVAACHPWPWTVEMKKKAQAQEDAIAAACAYYASTKPADAP